MEYKKYKTNVFNDKTIVLYYLGTKEHNYLYSFNSLNRASCKLAKI